MVQHDRAAAAPRLEIDTLRRRIVILALSILAPAMVLAGLLIWSLELQARHSLIDQTQRTAKALSLVVDRQFDEQSALLDSLASSPDLLAGDFTAFDRRVRAIRNRGSRWVVVHDAALRQLVNTRAPVGTHLPLAPLTDRSWAGERDGRRVTNLIFGPDGRAPVIGFTRAVRLHDGRQVNLGVITLASDFDRVFADQGLPTQWTGAVIDATNALVARSRDSAKLLGRKASADMQAAIAKAPAGVVATQTLDGIETISAYQTLPGYGWTVIVGVPRGEFSLVAGGSLGWAVLMALTLLGGALLLATRAALKIETPVRSLAAGVRAWSAGGAFAPPPIRGPAEVRELADRFQDALSALSAREGALRDAEARLQLALKASGSGFWDWDLATGEVSWSAELYEMLGRPPEGQALLAYFMGLVHPDDRASAEATASLAVETGEPFTFDFRVLLGEAKQTRWLRSHARPAAGAGGPTSRLIGVNLDVTDLHAQQAALEAANARLADQVQARTREFDHIWRLSRDAFLIADEHGVWLRVSPAWTEILGWSQDELTGRTCEWMEHPDDQASTRAQVERVTAGEVVSRFENRFRTRAGDYRWFSWTAVEFEGLHYCVARDVTAEKEAVVELERAQDALRQAQKMESIGQLTGGVAHDFNNLLTPILGALDMVRRRAQLEERDARLLGAAAESAERARILVQRLLAFARRQPLQPKPVDVAELLDGVGALVASTLGPRIRVVLDAPRGLPPARGDVNQLEMALLNLAVNARDAMPDGGVLTIAVSAPEIGPTEVEGLRRGRYVRISVVDTGEGMTPTTLARAVEPFFSTKGVGKGTGLGLSMVHGLAAQLGGGLRIASRVGVGTTVDLWLPVASAQQPPPAEPRPADAPALQAAGVVLLIDDEQLVRLTTADMLGALGCSVVEAAGAREALRLLAGGLRPSLIITDHLMPDMTGAELAQVVRADYPSIPLLVVSGYAEVDTLPADLPRLRKPFVQAELAAEVTTLMRQTLQPALKAAPGADGGGR